MRVKNSVLVLLISACVLPVSAQEVMFNVINLQDSAQVKVPQNQITAVLAIETLAANRVQASEQNTQKLNRVLQAMATQGLKGQLLNRSVNEEFEYANQTQRSKGWLDSAQVQVYSENMTAVNALIAQWPQEVRLQSQQYGLSEHIKRQYVLQATDQALKHFHEQAQQVSMSLGYKRYRIVEMHIASSPNAHMPVYNQTLLKAATMADAAEVATDLAGEATVRVDVSGKIQLH